MRIKQKYMIDFAKGITWLLVLFLINYFNQINNLTAWVYFCLHGSYGIMWVLKSYIFPDKTWESRVGIPYALLILLGLFSGVFLWGDLSNPYNWFLIYIVGSFGLLGAYDDFKKIKNKNSSGVSFKIKLIWQVLIAIIGIFILLVLPICIEKVQKNLIKLHVIGQGNMLRKVQSLNLNYVNKI